MSVELSFAYIKSEGIDTTCEEDVYKELENRQLEVVQAKDLFMGYMNLRKHQPILFDIKGDMNDIWKIQGAARMIGTTIHSLLVQGEDAIQQCFDTKVDIRNKYALPREFDREKEVSYPNYIHASDNKAQVQHDIDILIPEHSAFVREVNGEHAMMASVW